MTVNVKKIGGSVAVLIPKSIARDLGLVEGTALEATCENNSLRLRRKGRRPRRPISQIVAEMKSARRRKPSADLQAVIDDPAVGKEIW